MASWRTIILFCWLWVPASAAAQQLATRPRPVGVPAEQSAAVGLPRPLPLSGPSGDHSSKTAGAHRPLAGTSGPSLTTMVASLATVLGVFLLAAWALRKSLKLPGRVAMLPPEVAEVLGRLALAPRQPAELVRIGQKLILVSISAAGVRTLTEITDKAEVDRLTGLCRQAHPQSSTAAFRQVFQQFGRQPAKGFLDAEPSLSLARDSSDLEEPEA